MVAVMNHQQLVPYVNDSGANRLVNIDEHSDLADAEVKGLNCGTWVSYVRWRKKGEYLWIRNNRSTSLGHCNWGRGSNNWDAGTDWKKTGTRYPGKRLGMLPLLRGCVGVGLCMSPEWSTEPMIVLFRELVDEFGIPYKKGRMNENRERSIRPPFRRAA
jgi:hypothetical protein